MRLRLDVSGLKSHRLTCLCDCSVPGMRVGNAGGLAFWALPSYMEEVHADFAAAKSDHRRQREKAMTVTAATAFPFDNSYARLPERFYARLDPSPVAKPRLLKLNEQLAEELGLDADALRSSEGIDVLAGNATPEGSTPLAMAYAGHQFGGWSPQLGDGRAILLGEILDQNGKRRDVQLKGSGPTPFSRSGDGRSPLGPALREYMISEAMTALGVPTTRSLAVTATGEPVLRETALPGGVLTRVAASHIRVGTFQFFLGRKDNEGLKQLADYAIQRHYPAAGQAENPYLALLEAVIARQAALIGQWMSFGFIHGVMNTDNMTISGETIDYGPCAFMDTYKAGMVFSSIDRQGRYAYVNQPPIGHWNLVCLAQALLPLFSDDDGKAIEIAQGAVNQYPALFQAAWLERMRAKLGLSTAEEGDYALVEELLELMEVNQADFTLTFRHLANGLDAATAGPPARDQFIDPTAFDAWAGRWLERQQRETASVEQRRTLILATNPMFIPRNHRVEAAIDAAYQDDFEPFEELLKVMQRPFDDQPEFAEFTRPPAPDQIVHQTFCGT